MPPKIQITEEQIIEGALNITREQGVEALNARNLAKALGCSVQPIFRAFTNMGKLKEKVFERVAAEYSQFLLQSMSGEDRLLGLLMAYIRFAQKEKNYFKWLHMSDRIGISETQSFTEIGINKEIVGMIAKVTNLSIKDATAIYIGTFFAAHGIASMIATNHCSFSDEEIRTIMTDIFDGMEMKYKKKQ